jgi:high affinity sulfate transporter 1
MGRLLPDYRFIELRIRTLVPILTWLPRYNRALFRSDLIAGITLTAFAVPELMAYAQLAGLPPEYGLYAGIIAPLIYCMFGTIREISIGPSSSIAILIAGTLSLIAGTDPRLYISLAALVAVMAGTFSLLAWGFRLGFIVHLISETVLKGFLAGVGIVIISTQVFRIMGILPGPRPFFDEMIYLFSHIPETNLPTLIIGLGSIAFIFIAQKKYPRLPASLIAIIISILLMTYTRLGDLGIAVVGTIPSGLPGLVIPEISFSNIQLLFPVSLAVFILAYVENMSIGRTLAKKNGYIINPDQELFALGTTSLLTGFFQGFPISGSFSRTALNEINQAATQLTGVISALLIAIVTLYFTDLFSKIPEAVIGSLIIVAVTRLIDIRGLVRIASISLDEFAIALATCVGVLLFGLVSGVFIGVLLSITDILYRVSSPRIAILGRVPGTRHYADRIRHPENEPIPGVLIIRVDAPIIFANAEMVKDRILDIIIQDSSFTLVLLDLSSSPIIDISASDMIVDLSSELTARGIQIRIAEATWQVRRMLRLSGVEETIGEEITQSTSINTVLKDWDCQNHSKVVCIVQDGNNAPKDDS